MEHRSLTLDELAAELGRDRRELEKAVQRGRIPGRKLGGHWHFDPAEITQWLEQEIRGYTDEQLQIVEGAQHSEEVQADLPVASLLKPECVEVPLEARTKRSVIEGLLEVAGRSWQIWEPAALLQAILAREDVLSTGFENGVAIPHPRTPLASAQGESLVAFGRTLSGIPFGAPRRSLSDLFFLVLCRDSRTHLLVLARLGRMLQLPDFIDELRAAPDSKSTYEFLCAADRRLSGE